MLNYTQLIQELNSGLSTKDREKVSDVSELILMNRENAGEAIKAHYNNVVYNLDNGNAGITTYLKESIVREILQNIIDCDYNGREINLGIKFNDTSQSISFEYNENGFKISNIISFFSLDHTSKDSNNTGAFGIGAKGAILATKKIIIKSVYNDREVDSNLWLRSEFEICSLTKSNKKTLEITDLKLEQCSAEEKKGTSLQLFLQDSIYKEIKDNLHDLTGVKNGKGKYLTPIDLVFASLKKSNISIKITIANEIYDVFYNTRTSSSTFGFLFGGKRAEVTFKVFIGGDSQFSYLIPCSRNEIKDMPAFIEKHSYNIFSTYELTGALGSDSYLSNFYINIPTIDKKCEKNEDTKYYITNDRKGVQDNKKNTVEKHLINDFQNMIHEFGDSFHFVEDGRLSYMLTHFYKFIIYKIENANSDEWTKIKNKILYYIRIESGNINFFIKDLKRFRYSDDFYRTACEVKDKYNFVFAYQVHEKKTEYSKFYIFNHKYKFIVKGKEFEISQYREDESWNIRKFLIIDILSSYSYQNGNEIRLLAAQSDSKFDENTLNKLLAAINDDNKIRRAFDAENSILYIGENEYHFTPDFKISKTSILYYAYRNSIGTLNDEKQGLAFFNFIREIFLNNLFSKNKDEIGIIERIKKYKSLQFFFEYNSQKDNLLNVTAYNNVYIPIEKDIDVSNIEYNKLVSITGLSNYKLLKGKSFDDFIIGENVIDTYGFDIDKISNFICNLQNIQAGEYERISSTLNKTILCYCDFNLGDEDVVAFVKDNIIEEIVLIKNMSLNYNPENYDYIAVIPYKKKDGKPAAVKISRISELLDFMLKTNGAIKNLYKPTKTPIRVMLDQYSAKLKPILPVDKSEFIVLLQYINKITATDKIYFAKDLTNKLYGYSTACCICGYDKNILNAFQIKSDIKYILNNKTYNLSLYLCSNDFFESEGWIISDVKFRDSNRKYTVTFSEWIENIKENQSISTNLLRCEITVVQKTTYSAFSFNNEDEEQMNSVKSHKIVLTPLMAVKWYSDNSSK